MKDQTRFEYGDRAQLWFGKFWGPVFFKAWTLVSLCLIAGSVFSSHNKLKKIANRSATCYSCLKNMTQMISNIPAV